MAGKPEVSMGLGLGTAALVYSIHNGFMPLNPDMRASKAGDKHLETCRKQALWTEVGTVAGISLIAKDPLIFIIGGLSIVVLDVMDRFNIFTDIASGSVITNPLKGQMTSNPSPAPVAPNVGALSGGYSLAAVR